MTTATPSSDVEIECGQVTLYGGLEVPDEARSIVVFAHGSGSSRHSPRNQQVARYLREGGLGTLLFDLLTVDEERVDAVTGELRFNIEFLAQRLVAVTEWLGERQGLQTSLAYFGSSTGAAAALVAATRTAHPICAIVSRGGRPDLAGTALADVQAPTLLIVGGYDAQVLELNQAALEKLRCDSKLAIVPRATHLFEEPGALDQVAQHARGWFTGHCP